MKAKHIQSLSVKRHLERITVWRRFYHRQYRAWQQEVNPEVRQWYWQMMSDALHILVHHTQQLKNQ